MNLMCRPGWPWTYRDPIASASLVLRLRAYITTPGKANSLTEKRFFSLMVSQLSPAVFIALGLSEAGHHGVIVESVLGQGCSPHRSQGAERQEHHIYPSPNLS